MTILIIDNYDSFTYNLFQYIGDVTGEEAAVHRNDKISFEQIVEMNPDHIVVSPGPGSPDNTRDFGICARVLKELGSTIPILGVCLGHQGMIHHMGGKVVRAGGGGTTAAGAAAGAVRRAAARVAPPPG